MSTLSCLFHFIFSVSLYSMFFFYLQLIHRLSLQIWWTQLTCHIVYTTYLSRKITALNKILICGSQVNLVREHLTMQIGSVLNSWSPDSSRPSTMLQLHLCFPYPFFPFFLSFFQLPSLLLSLSPPFFPFCLSFFLSLSLSLSFCPPSLPLLWLFQNIIYIHLKFYSKKIISFFTPKRNDKQHHRNPFKLYLWTKKPTCTNTFIPLLQCKLAFSCFPGWFLLARFWFLSLLPSQEPHFVVHFLSSLYLQSQALWDLFS